ncbi:MAG: 50S ribosomal protein L29 [Desulfobacterales bacterium CG23_combo_of_CG06-09_8_20_14_all_51_8]|nr:MAG: 50S ribosomal protein L29 [Desulfobacterales bacterium CG23_combo_of_CG06-09_8_20_14_all_51_8]
MKASEIKDMGGQDLDAKLTDLTETLFNLRFQHTTGQLENPQRMRQVKRDIARIKTFKRQRTIA